MKKKFLYSFLWLALACTQLQAQPTIKKDSALDHSITINLVKPPEPPKESSNLATWITIISTVLGGALVMLGQFIERSTATKRDEKKEMGDIIFQLHYLVNLLPTYLKDLAFYKVDIRLQAYLSEHATGDEDRKRYNDEYYKDYVSVSEVKLKITDTTAKFISLLVRYDNIKNSRVFATEIGTLPQVTFDDKARAYLTDAEVEEDQVNADVQQLYDLFAQKYLSFKEALKKIVP